MQPYHPTSHFQSLSFLCLSSHHKSQNLEQQRERERERETEEMRGAFKCSVPWVVGSVSGNLSHPVYAGQISARDRRGLAGPLPGHSSSLSFLSAACLPRLKISVCKTFPRRLLPIDTLKPKANKHMSGCPRPQQHNRGGIKILINRILLMQQQLWPNHTTACFWCPNTGLIELCVLFTVSYIRWKVPEN